MSTYTVATFVPEDNLLEGFVAKTGTVGVRLSFPAHVLTNVTPRDESNQDS